MGKEEENVNGNGTEQENIDALLEAARYNELEDVKTLASSGVSLNSMDSEGRTVWHYLGPCLTCFFGQLLSALHMAAANGHLGIVEYLIKSGVDLNVCNAEKNTPLHWACLNGRIEVVKNLILAGAKLSSLNRCISNT
ncbi:hypothetical protein C5167_046202 [Papaver somniferum]|uniref:Uncharacterized protein n=1 Tax=Papaver somniferum TaxID=3469 RepID=A0A4Y7LD51_PAPSO|nr:hypothetical protein C5167_046202 [Papaver somniferum]